MQDTGSQSLLELLTGNDNLQQTVTTTLNKNVIEDISLNSLPFKGSSFVAGLTICVLNGLCFLAIVHQGLQKEEIKFIFMAAYAGIDAILGLYLALQNILLILGVFDDASLVEYKCYMLYGVSTVTINADTLCLLLLTLDQFLRIQLHIKYSLHVTKKKAYALLGLAGSVVGGNFVGMCIMWHAHGGCQAWGTMAFWYQYYTQTILFFAPLVAIIALHGCIFFVARKQLKRSMLVHPGQSETSNKSIIIKGQLKAIITLTVLTGILVLTWLPSNILTVLHWMGPSIQLPPFAFETAAFVYWFNFLLNPFVYFVRVQEIKLGIKKLLCKNCF